MIPSSTLNGKSLLSDDNQCPIHCPSSTVTHHQSNREQSCWATISTIQSAEAIDFQYFDSCVSNSQSTDQSTNHLLSLYLHHYHHHHHPTTSVMMKMTLKMMMMKTILDQIVHSNEFHPMIDALFPFLLLCSSVLYDHFGGAYHCYYYSPVQNPPCPHHPLYLPTIELIFVSGHCCDLHHDPIPVDDDSQTIWEWIPPVSPPCWNNRQRTHQWMHRGIVFYLDHRTRTDDLYHCCGDGDVMVFENHCHKVMMRWLVCHIVWSHYGDCVDGDLYHPLVVVVVVAVGCILSWFGDSSPWL